jgi:hypothetical protein
MFHREWTDERVTELRDLRSRSLSVSAIGARMGVSRNSIIGKLYRMGCNCPEENQDAWTPFEIETLKIVWATGATVREVMAEIRRICGTNRTTRAISAKADRIGLTKRMRKKRMKSWAFGPDPQPVKVQTECAPLNIPLMKVEAFHCREVVGRGDDGLALFCGHPRIDEYSFCAFHKQINYHKPNPNLRNMFR